MSRHAGFCRRGRLQLRLAIDQRPLPWRDHFTVDFHGPKHGRPVADSSPAANSAVYAAYHGQAAARCGSPATGCHEDAMAATHTKPLLPRRNPAQPCRPLQNVPAKSVPARAGSAISQQSRSTTAHEPRQFEPEADVKQLEAPPARRSFNKVHQSGVTQATYHSTGAHAVSQCLRPSPNQPRPRIAASEQYRSIQGRFARWITLT